MSVIAERTRRRTKIVCTIGPASNSPEMRCHAASPSVPPEVMKCALYVGTSCTPAREANTFSAPPISFLTVPW